MTRQLTSPIPRTPVLLAVDELRRIGEMRGNIEEHGFKNYEFRDAAYAPTPAERGVLQVRQQGLTHWLTPATSRQLDVEITAMFSTMSYRGGDETDLLLVQRIYKDDLAGLPGFALSEACARFRQGAIGDPRFVPKQGEIRQDALRIARDFAKELQDISAILSAKVPAHLPSLEERKATIATWREKHLKPTIEAAKMPEIFPRKKPPPPDVRYGESVPEPQPDTRPLPQLSEEALAIIARQSSP